MIKLHHLTIKNFLSVGNCTQAIDFNQHDLTLILGENRDQGGNDAGSRNGCGKSTITHALSYAIFGQALTKIKVDNLINKMNERDMLVTLTFSKNGNDYRIERGRKPTVFKFFINDVAQDEGTDNNNDAQGDSRDTQEEIIKLFMMDHTMYKNVVSLNTYSTPFLGMKAAEQREIIENLLGITILSEKAELLKKQIKDTKDSLTKETAIIDANIAANNKIQESIDRLKQTQIQWGQTKDNDCIALADRIDRMKEFDIDTEIKNHETLQQQATISSSIESLNLKISHLETSLFNADKKQKQYEQQVESLSSNKCPMCEQGLHTTKHAELIQVANDNIHSAINEIESIAVKLQPLYDELDALNSTNTGLFDTKITTVYKTLTDALNHKNKLNGLLEKLETRYLDNDPYQEQIDELCNKALTVINYDNMNELTKLKEHQDLLLKLLTNKDSFLRKQIIEQNLSLLNSRLGMYLEKMGLPHSVVFNSDLSTDISYLGRDLDFDNLSRGEMTRVSLSLSFAFRDVWENLYQPINLMLIDEMLDAGLDASGAENATNLLRNMIYERNKNVFLISHKEELTSKVTNVLKAVKENSFTSYTYEE